MNLENGYLLSFPEGLKWSDEELFDFCQQNPGLNIERDAEQNIIIMSPTGSLSGAISMAIGAALYNWNVISKKGLVFDASTGFTLPDGSMRSPDVSWVSNEKWDKLTDDQKRKFAPVCPEFVVEVKSPTDSLETLQSKMLAYLSNGTQLGWLFDVDNEMVYIYSPIHELRVVKSFDQTLAADDTLPGFVLDLRLLKTQ